MRFKTFALTDRQIICTTVVQGGSFFIEVTLVPVGTLEVI